MGGCFFNFNFNFCVCVCCCLCGLWRLSAGSCESWNTVGHSVAGHEPNFVVSVPEAGRLIIAYTIEVVRTVGSGVVYGSNQCIVGGLVLLSIGIAIKRPDKSSKSWTFLQDNSWVRWCGWILVGRGDVEGHGPVCCPVTHYHRHCHSQPEIFVIITDDVSEEFPEEAGVGEQAAGGDGSADPPGLLVTPHLIRTSILDECKARTLVRSTEARFRPRPGGGQGGVYSGAHYRQQQQTLHQHLW